MIKALLIIAASLIAVAVIYFLLILNTVAKAMKYMEKDDDNGTYNG